MSTYTVSGYLSALIVRENRTVLVEGRDDKHVISRAMLELLGSGHQLSAPTVIDSVELVRGDDRPMGNRALVEHIYGLCAAEGLPLAAVVDREFREFELGPPVSDLVCRHVTITDTLFWTRGHSMENYFFEPEFFLAFIKSQFPEHVDIDSLRACDTAFESIMRWAAAVGLALNDNRLLRRSFGIGKYSHWGLAAAGEWQLDIAAYCSALQRRGVERAAQERLAVSIEQRWRDFKPGDETMRLVAHGHVAWESIWCGLAAVLLDRGASRAVVEGVAYGYSEAKLRFAADILARRIGTAAAEVVPGLWLWLLDPTETNRAAYPVGM